MISVTIATYKRPDGLMELLESLASQTLNYQKYEIIICDSNSGEPTNAVVKSVVERYPALVLRHCHTVNILAAKRNLGIKEARHDIVIFMDDDCVATSDYLERYLDKFKQPRHGKFVYCGEVRFPDEWINKSNYYRFRDEEGFHIKSQGGCTALDFRTIVVMNLAFSKNNFLNDKITVNEGFVGYGMEDQELGWQLQQAGYAIFGCDARVYHKEKSNNIQGYGKKIYHTARDGVTNLQNICPAAFKDYPFDRQFEKVAYALIRCALFNSVFFKIALSIAKLIESRPFFYSRLIYRYILGCCYISGVAARATEKKAGTENWYN
jgi:glycosyltransferase involved in cell wall biosynthesis